MTYSVTWVRAAQAELAAAWLAADDREAVTRAAAEIDRRLAADAPDEGESRFGDVRITFERPLVATFHVNRPKAIVVRGSRPAVRPTPARVSQYPRSCVMAHVVFPDSDAAVLAAADGPVEICGLDGVVLGWFTPRKDGRRIPLDPPPAGGPEPARDPD